jgi:DNA gyrase inhibitor GyrI
MAPDDITQRHLSKQRVRGAPSTKPGTSGFVRDYDASELLRQTQRSLVCPLAGEIDLAKVREAFAKLQAAASAQKLKVTGDPFYVVKADPMTIVPHEREHEVCLPVRGEAKDDGEVKSARLEGGYFIVSTTDGGLEDVENVYTWLFGKFLPARKHELTRPYILHRIVETGEGVAVEVQVPATLSIKPVRVPGAGAEEGT